MMTPGLWRFLALEDEVEVVFARQPALRLKYMYFQVPPVHPLAHDVVRGPASRVLVEDARDLYAVGVGASRVDAADTQGVDPPASLFVLTCPLYIMTFLRWCRLLSAS